MAQKIQLSRPEKKCRSKNSRWGKYLRQQQQHLSLLLNVSTHTREREKNLSSVFSYQDSFFPRESKKMLENEKLKKKKRRRRKKLEIEKYWKTWAEWFSVFGPHSRSCWPASIYYSRLKTTATTAAATTTTTAKMLEWKKRTCVWNFEEIQAGALIIASHLLKEGKTKRSFSPSLLLLTDSKY